MRDRRGQLPVHLAPLLVQLPPNLPQMPRQRVALLDDRRPDGGQVSALGPDVEELAHGRADVEPAQLVQRGFDLRDDLQCPGRTVLARDARPQPRLQRLVHLPLHVQNPHAATRVQPRQPRAAYRRQDGNLPRVPRGGEVGQVVARDLDRQLAGRQRRIPDVQRACQAHPRLPISDSGRSRRRCARRRAHSRRVRRFRFG